MDFYGELYLRISGDNLDFNKISTDFDIKATKCIKKGTCIINDYFTKKDTWIYKVNLTSLPSLNNKLFDLLNGLSTKKDIISRIRKNNEITITVDIRSDNAQIGFNINNNNINILSQLKLSLCFNVLSFGLVRD